MNSLRVARSALRARPSALKAVQQPLLRRGYADVAPDKIQLTLALPHQVRRHRSRDGVNDHTSKDEGLSWRKLWAMLTCELAGYLQEQGCVRLPYTEFRAKRRDQHGIL